MKTKFSIISYYDPYGDMKSNRKQLQRKNYESDLLIDEIKKIINTYSNDKYYNGVDFAKFDNRSKNISNFDTSYFLTSKAQSATYQSIPGY